MNCSIVSIGSPESLHLESYLIFCCSMSLIMSFNCLRGRILAYDEAPGSGVLIDDYYV